MVGIIVNCDKQILVSQRPDHVHQGGLWEFPGGKIEINETAKQALYRELSEELGIKVLSAKLLKEINYDYADRRVVLHTWLVEDYQGFPIGLENQPIQWMAICDLYHLALPAASREIIKIIRNGLIGT